MKRDLRVTTRRQTWEQLLDAIRITVLKHPGMIAHRIENDLPEQLRQKPHQKGAECEVRLSLTFFRGTRRAMTLHVRDTPTAHENLRRIAIALEMMRLAEIRNVQRILAVLMQEIYGPTPYEPPPAYYKALHIAPGAPLAVCEAAYAVLLLTALRDNDGEAAQRLEAAITEIRAEHAAQAQSDVAADAADIMDEMDADMDEAAAAEEIHQS